MTKPHIPKQWRCIKCNALKVVEKDGYTVYCSWCNIWFDIRKNVGGYYSGSRN